MKKIVGLIFILSALMFPVLAQDNSSDDVYYQGDDNTVSPAEQEPDNTENNGEAPDYQTFYDQLSPYGNWVDYPGNGYVWVPSNMPADFSPYMSGGHWVYTDMGWTWVSDYPWGWGPYHYGRWFFDDAYGWMWMPGYQWAPAWVVWGEYGGYYCWAPIGPRAVISMHYRPDPRFWHFCPHENMGREDFGRYVVRNEVIMNTYHITNVTEINNHVNIISHANTYNQGVYFAGPKASEVEHYTGQKVQRVTINNSNLAQRSEVHGTQLNIYRPTIAKTATQHAAPPKVAKPEELKPTPGNEHAVSPLQRGNANQAKPTETRPAQQPVKQEWTPPRQSTPQRVAPQPRQQSQPQRQPQQSQPQQRAPERNFIPTERPAPQQQHYSAPRPAPAPAPSRGGGRR